MELTFEQIDGYWISEFEVSADFNLHIERDTEGRLDIYQRTAGGRYQARIRTQCSKQKIGMALSNSGRATLSVMGNIL